MVHLQAAVVHLQAVEVLEIVVVHLQVVEVPEIVVVHLKAVEVLEIAVPVQAAAEAATSLKRMTTHMTLSQLNEKAQVVADLRVEAAQTVVAEEKVVVEEEAVMRVTKGSDTKTLNTKTTVTTMTATVVATTMMDLDTMMRRVDTIIIHPEEGGDEADWVAEVVVSPDADAVMLRSYLPRMVRQLEHLFLQLITPSPTTRPQLCRRRTVDEEAIATLIPLDAVDSDAVDVGVLVVEPRSSV